MHLAACETTRVFGVNPDTIPSIEAAYDEFMNLAEAHFREHPFLLGGNQRLVTMHFSDRYSPIWVAIQNRWL